MGNHYVWLEEFPSILNIKGDKNYSKYIDYVDFNSLNYDKNNYRVLNIVIDDSYLYDIIKDEIKNEN